MENLTVNTILNFNLQMTNKSMSNDYKSEGFGMQISKDDLSWVSVESTKVFAQSSSIFALIINFFSIVSRKIDIVNKCIFMVSR